MGTAATHFVGIDVSKATLDCCLLAPDGRAPMPVTKAKIAARRRAFERMEAREFSPPTFLRGRTPVSLDAAPTPKVDDPVLDKALEYLRDKLKSQASPSAKAA